ncbi:hypothetical protein GOV03_03910 [Candidatus Woesearchaeota archaeon]|nr:hypothetical protein [Candidatus Woesearchaeota archaeon]
MTNFKAKSVIVSKKPRKEEEGLWSVMVALFGENNPHLKGRVPSQVLEFNEVEKTRIKELRNISFYLAGNDVVINNLVSVNIELKKGIVTLTGKQELP